MTEFSLFLQLNEQAPEDCSAYSNTYITVLRTKKRSNELQLDAFTFIHITLTYSTVVYENTKLAPYSTIRNCSTI